MKHDSDKEIDFLLRRHARREAQPALTKSGASASSRSNALHEANAGAHLDADEMNAYAEGALPAAARARYAAHLADCDSCRKIVTRLTLAANVTIEDEKRVAAKSAAPSASWRGWLAALFAPPVLRYAVPALALFAVTIVAFVAMREQEQTPLVARNDQEHVSSSISVETEKATESSEQITRSSNTNDADASSKVMEATRPAANTVASSRAKETQAGTATDSIAPTVAEPSTPAMVAKDAPQKRAENYRTDEAARVAQSAPPTPAERSPSLERDKKNEKEEVGKVQEPKLGVEANRAGAPQSGARVPNAEVAAQREQPARARRSVASKSAVSADGRARGAADLSDEDSAETRNVGGRRFRRQGSAWIDTSYNSTRSTINVRRGTEQYRALMADEPGLRSIAEQLGGEVLIVWKGRAYRIY